VLGIPFVVLTLVFFGLWPLAAAAPIDSLLLRFGISLVASLLAVSFSPTVTIAVIAESRARGPLTELVLPLVILADLILIVGFALAMQFVRVASGTPATRASGCSRCSPGNWSARWRSARWSAWGSPSTSASSAARSRS
jgi:hypothetical protein